MQDLRLALEQAKDGDPRAFAVVVERFQDMAVGYAYSVLGDFHLAQDAAQEAFIDACLNLNKVYGPEAFPNWLRRIVFKHCDRILRRKALDTTSLETATAVSDAGETPATVAEAAELATAVQQAVRSLPADVRMAIALFYMSGYSIRDIGEFLGAPTSTIKSRLHRGRKKLGQEGVLRMENELRQNRPSGDDTFVTAVNSILEAATASDEDAVKTMLEKNPSLVQPHGDRDHGHGSVTLLHYAAQAGMVSLAEFALDNGADVNARDESHGLTPLGWAVVFPNEQHDVARLLIGRGAEQDVWTATAMNKGDVVEELVAANPALVHDRLSEGDWRMQPLHLAAWKGHAPVVEVLLAHSADSTSTDDLGTPLHRAEEAGHTQVVKLLREHGRA